MSPYRTTLLANNEIYHIFNRGVEKRPVFTFLNDYKRAIDTIRFYRFSDPPVRLSRYLTSTDEQKIDILNQTKTKMDVEIIAYCLMPNHVHFILKQLETSGISSFMAKVTNSYTKYFNTRHERVGPLFQGSFKAVRVESDEQLLHLSRYVHLNPVASFLIELKDLSDYKWSSLPEYLNPTGDNICNHELIMQAFNSSESYREFIYDFAHLKDELRNYDYLYTEE